MNIVLANKTKRITDLFVPDMSITQYGNLNVYCEVRGGITLTSPTFILTDSPNVIEYWKYNYVYCEEWGRYYFIEDVTIDGHLMYIHCTEDYLASWYNEIINSTFYCTRCVSDNDDSLTDTFFPAKAYSQTKTVVAGSPWKDIKSGNYILAISSGGNNDPHIGTNAYYVMSDSEITDFMNDLMSKADITLTGLADSIVKTMVNPIQYIRSCYWFPFEIDANMTSVSSIAFSWWTAEASAKVLDLEKTSDTYTEFKVEVPFEETMFNEAEREYMKFAPYSQYRLTCYPFGVFELSNDIISQYIKGNPLEIQLDIDHITGMANFILICGEENDIPHLVTTAQVGVEIPVGEILQDYAGTVLNSASAIGMAVTGHEARALTDVYNAIDSVVPNATIQGIAGGFAQLMIGENWHLNRYFQDIDIDPELVGEPCCKNERVGDLRGFAKFSNVEIKGDMLKSEMEMIESLLEEGIFVGEE